jgi:hypothetical protein
MLMLMLIDCPSNTFVVKCDNEEKNYSENVSDVETDSYHIAIG